MKTIKNLKAEEIRKSILQLAIQGKLVKQDSNDEPASELVKRIYAEKQKLIQEGKIKKDKNESFIFKGDDNCYYEKIGNSGPVKLEDLPFDIPDSWTWIRLKDLIHIQTGASFKKEQSIQEAKSGFVRVLRGGNILPFQFLLKNDDLYIPQELVSNDILLRKNDLITPAVTSLENIGKIAVITNDLINVTAGGFVYIFRPYIDDEILSNLIADYVSSSAYHSMMKDITKKSGQAFYNMNKEKLLQLYFPIAPFAEMIRIVHKVKKCEPLIDKYSLIEEKLSILEEEFPEKIKKSILQYAIEGKLVKQDPNDEPASVLLERIKAEKENLIKEGKIKRDKNESYIFQGDDKNYYEKIGKAITKIDVPFEVSYGWSWTKLKNIAFITKLAGFEYTQYVNPNLTSDGIPLFKGKNVQNSKVIYEFEGHIPLEISNQLSRSQVTKKCLLTPYVGTIGNVGIHYREGIYHLGSNVGKIEIYNNYNTNVTEEYVFYYLKSYSGFNELTKFKKATAQESISIDAIRETLIPIPPYRIQVSTHEKVSKINQLIDK